MAILRIGLIGYGNWTRQAYIPALRRDGRARIVAAAARTEATQKRICDELGDDVDTFAGPVELLKSSELDAVMIAVPDELHEQALVAALDAGVAIYYEPPVSNQRSRIHAVLTRLLAASQVTHADLELGFIPAFERMTEIVKSGAIGQPQNVTIRLQANWGPIADSDLCTINLLAPWYVDLINRVLGAMPKRVLVLDGHGTPRRAQNQSIGHLDYDGVWGTFQANITSVVKVETTVEVNGQDGDLIVDLFTGEIRLRSRENNDWSVEQVPALQPHAGWPGMHESVSAFLDAVETGKPSAMNAELVARLHLIGLAAEASVDSGTWAQVESLDSLKR